MMIDFGGPSIGMSHSNYNCQSLQVHVAHAIHLEIYSYKALSYKSIPKATTSKAIAVKAIVLEQYIRLELDLKYPFNIITHVIVWAYKRSSLEIMDGRKERE